MSEVVTLSVIVPVYNERATIEEVLRRIARSPLTKEVIVVDDFSTDGTREFLLSHRDFGYTLILHERNRGKGAGIRSAQSRVQGEFVVVQDADLELDPDDYHALLRPLRRREAGLVLGTRVRCDGGTTVAGMATLSMRMTHLANRLLSRAAGVMFGRRITDIMAGYKMFRRDAFQRLTLESEGFEIEVEMVAKALRAGHSVEEVPVRYRPRGYRDGKKIRWRHAAKIVVALLKHRYSRLARGPAPVADPPRVVLLEPGVRASEATSGPEIDGRGSG